MASYLLSRENEHELCSSCRVSGIIIPGPNRSEKDRHLCTCDGRIRRNPSQNAAFFTKSAGCHTLIPSFHGYARTPGFLHRCFPVFRNISVRTPGSFGMLFTRCGDEVSQ